MATAAQPRGARADGLRRSPAATPNDLVVALRLDADADAVRSRSPRSTRRCTPIRPTARRRPRSPRRAPPASALRRSPGGAIALVSVPGASAAVEAMDALEAGADVMVFSDNVPVEQEVALKRYAAARGLLVMGPDCGTAVVGGVGLGFANVGPPRPGRHRRRLRHRLPAGARPARPRRRRRRSPRARRRRSRPVRRPSAASPPATALRRLDADPDVELVVVVSKPPAPEVAAEHHGVRRGRSARRSSSRLLGAGQPDLTAATEAVLRAARPRRRPTGRSAAPARRPRDRAAAARAVRRRHAHATRRRCSSRPAGVRRRPRDRRLRRRRATPTGRAHPMIDPTPAPGAPGRGRRRPRDRRASCSTSSSATAPRTTRPPRSRRRSPASRPPVVVTVVGTGPRPAGPRPPGRDALAAAGAEVHLSNAGATRRALDLLGGAPMSQPTVVSVGADLLADAVASQAAAVDPGRLAAADARHRGRPRHRRRSTRAPGRQRPRARADARRPGDAGRRRARRARLLGLERGPVPARRPADRPGSAPPARCAAR